MVSKSSPTVGFGAKFWFILLLACRSTVLLDNPTNASLVKVRNSQWHLLAGLMALDMSRCFYLPYMSLHTMVMCKVKTGWPRIIQIKAQDSSQAIHNRNRNVGYIYDHPELWDIMEKQTGFSYHFLEKQAFDKCWQSCLQKADPPSVHIGRLLLLTNNTLIWRDLLPD